MEGPLTLWTQSFDLILEMVVRGGHFNLAKIVEILVIDQDVETFYWPETLIPVFVWSQTIRITSVDDCSLPQ